MKPLVGLLSALVCQAGSTRLDVRSSLARFISAPPPQARLTRLVSSRLASARLLTSPSEPTTPCSRLAGRRLALLAPLSAARMAGRPPVAQASKLLAPRWIQFNWINGALRLQRLEPINHTCLARLISSGVAGWAWLARQPVPEVIA